MTRRPVVAVVLVLLAVSIGLAVTLSRPAADRAAEGLDVPSSTGPGSAGAGTPSPIPVPGHEVYGFVPYWEMDATIADHLAATDLTTIGLFSVTHRKNGSLSTGENGYKRITGPIGRRIIADARDRGARTELVYTSFGAAKNDAFFTNSEARDRTIAELVSLAGDLGVDGIDVDVERLGIQHIPAYGEFVGRLRAALREANPSGQVSVATTANQRGSAMALAASLADRKSTRLNSVTIRSRMPSSA